MISAWFSPRPGVDQVFCSYNPTRPNQKALQMLGRGPTEPQDALPDLGTTPADN